MADKDRSPVTAIGLGLMGKALAATFLEAGHPTTVWNRSAGKADDLAARGAVVAPGPAEAVAAAELVVVCVTDNDVLHAVLDPVADQLKGRVVVNLSSGSSDQARANAAWAERHGFGYLDGAIMAVPAGVGGPQAVFFYAGPEDVYRRHADALGVLGGGTTYLGADHGLAALYDVALLGVMYGLLSSFVQGAALLDTAGVKASEFLPWATAWVDTVKLFATDYAGQIDAGDRAYPANDATMEVNLGAIGHVLHESESQGVNAELPRFLHELMGRTVAGGHGAHSFASMFEVFRGADRRA
ncbi:NAD(P)-dependent oxidoreductase [Streptomyces sedi]|uniref:NAD(P)-dependent oxidoreductase n=1 Tax=Streptomyces sedi TaxID=555059 RepID=A0A5C4UYW6_9ACTN|nr:NAD(P)-binding domain-containing protein [Streptomyces sedi]TNM28787.1 NAD(P)-dependent oxidoreductase [Streptomyces sedi]